MTNSSDKMEHRSGFSVLAALDREWDIGIGSMSPPEGTVPLFVVLGGGDGSECDQRTVPFVIHECDQRTVPFCNNCFSHLTMILNVTVLVRAL